LAEINHIAASKKISTIISCALSSGCSSNNKDYNNEGFEKLSLDAAATAGLVYMYRRCLSDAMCHVRASKEKLIAAAP
jgi:hypothetical protein